MKGNNMKNFKCKIAYLGTNFFGSQRQPNKRTVQGEIEAAIKQVTGEELTLTIAGRTDSGVHAEGQVINFKSETNLMPHALTKLLNRTLPSDVQIQSIEEVSQSFNARFNAKEKIYSYKFYTAKEVNPILDSFALCVTYKIDIKKMQQACNFIKGKHDFKAFMSTGGKVKDTIREVKEIKISKLKSNLYELTIKGNAFLYNMVRIIMGVLLRVGDGTLEPDQVGQIIQGGIRPKTKTAESKGLTLVSVKY